MAQALEGLPGVKNAVASFPERKAVVIYDKALVTTVQMCQALLKAGYVASPQANDREVHADSRDKSRDSSGYQSDRLVCYCFEYTRNDIERDFIQNARSLIMEKITAEKKAGGCDCANKNPKGR